KFSEKHANFIVNLGGAAAQDVKKLINLAKKSVKNKFKVKLEEEIQYLDH
ncbi:UDP-N-acetylenolpyruvoylglucosamine reductase, partial [Candidatus Jorgensenbacteria bacterium CG11_big_fil_rev_8_21_14_0_20_38_23]